MVFSSQIFLFLFLPVTLIGYALCRQTQLKNLWLLLVSILFYAYGAHLVVLVLLFSVTVNYVIAILLTKTKNELKRRLLLVLDIILNLSYLFYFKYYNFFRDNLNALTGSSSEFERIALPIGISFFTFQALSYCIDVYRDESLVQKNIINVALYITFFPQLIAGPIVRFSTISKEIGCSTVSAVDLKKEQPGSCMVMFIYGSGYLGKKKMFKIK